MQRNFKFDGFSVVHFEGQIIDLHNAYEIECIGTSAEGDTATLTFRRNQYAINPKSLPDRISLRCTGNVKVAFNNLNHVIGPLNEEGIEVAYFDEHCDWDSLIDEEIAETQKPLGLHLQFMNDLVVRIYCESITFEPHSDEGSVSQDSG